MSTSNILVKSIDLQIHRRGCCTTKLNTLYCNSWKELFFYFGAFTRTVNKYFNSRRSINACFATLITLLYITLECTLITLATSLWRKHGTLLICKLVHFRNVKEYLHKPEGCAYCEKKWKTRVLTLDPQWCTDTCNNSSYTVIIIIKRCLKTVQSRTILPVYGCKNLIKCACIQNQKQKNVYVAQYPVLRITQSVLH